MSHVSDASNASTFSPLTVTDSPSRWDQEDSRSASCARNTSPLPDTFMSDMPSPVNVFFSMLGPCRRCP